jgi:hypothetical protein
MTGDAITAARREAKRISRTVGTGYQQALEEVARAAGHGTWAAMLSAEGEARTAEPAPAPSVPEPDPDWRMRALERMEGSRHSPVDEAGISAAGGPIARAAFRMGAPVGLVAIALPVALLMTVDVAAGVPIPTLLTDAGVTTMLSAPFSLATLRSPDHRGARRARRVGRAMALMLAVLGAAFAMPTVARTGATSASDLIGGPARLALCACCFTLSMWTCAWEGRRMRRDRCTSSTRGRHRT